MVSEATEGAISCMWHQAIVTSVVIYKGLLASTPGFPVPSQRQSQLVSALFLSLSLGIHDLHHHLEFETPNLPIIQVKIRNINSSLHLTPLLPCPTPAILQWSRFFKVRATERPLLSPLLKPYSSLPILIDKGFRNSIINYWERTNRIKYILIN